MTRRRDDDHYGNAVRKPAPVEDLPLFGGEPTTPEPTHVIPVRAHLRRVPGEAPPSGADRRDAALAEHEADDAKREAVEYVRTELVKLYQERRAAALFGEAHVTVGVTADDIDAILHRWAACPRVLHEIPGHWKGAIFRDGSWELTGQRVRSARAHMRATELPVWRLRDASVRRAS